MQCEWEDDNCTAKKLNITSSDRQSVTTVDGHDVVLGKANGFWIEDAVCHYIPEKIAYFLPNVKIFGVSNSGLRAISKSDLAPFTKLKNIVIYGNELQYIDGDLFSLNTKIQRVILKEEKLLLINGPILEPLKQLNYIHIELKCATVLCERISCIPEKVKEFSKNCEFDVKYPGFRKYFEDLRRTVKNCAQWPMTDKVPSAHENTY